MVFIDCTGCRKKEDNIDEKIETEIKYMDTKISKSINLIIGNDENYNIKDQKSEVKSEENSESKKESSSSGSNGQTEGESGAQNSNKVTVMSIEYGKADEENWEEAKNEIEELYKSWANIKEDINTTQKVENEKLDEINKNIDNILTAVINKSKIDYMKEIVQIYDNLAYVTEKTKYNENDMYILKIKARINESYYNILDEDYESSVNNIELAKSLLDNVETDKKEIVSKVESLKNSAESKNKEIYIVKYIDFINALEYI